MALPRPDWLMVILVREWRWVAACTLACALAMLAALPFLTRQYEVTAALLFKPGREQAPPAVSGGAVAAPPFRRTEDVTSEAEIITSQALVESLVTAFGPAYFLARKPPETAWEHVKEALRSIVQGVRDAVTEAFVLVGLEKRLTPFEKVVSLLRNALTAEPVKRADVVEIKLRMPDQKAGVAVMNKLVELYIAEHIRAFKTAGSTQFLSERVAALRAELAALEAQRREFGRHRSLWDLDEQRRSLLAQQRELQQGLSRSEQDIGRVQAEITQAQAALATPPRETRVSRVEQASPAAQSLQARITELRARIERLRLIFVPDSRRIADEEAELVQLEKLLAAQSRSVTQSETFEINGGYRDTERGLAERRNRFAGLLAQRERQRSDDAQLNERLARLDAQGEEARRLARDIALAEQNYQLYARRLEEARISDALDGAAISNIAVIGRPTASVSPVAPRAKLLFLGALAAGLLGSFGFFVLRDALRPTVHARERAAAALGAPILARLPEVRP